MKSLRRFVSTYWQEIVSGMVGWLIGSLIFTLGVVRLHLPAAVAITAGVFLLLASDLIFAFWGDYWREQAEDFTDCVTEGVEAINEERAEQIGKHGWSEEHDDKYEEHELTHAASAYIEMAQSVERGEKFELAAAFSRSLWPWSPETFKPSADPRANLAKAGALIAAAYDRLDRSVQCESCDRWTPNVWVDGHGIYLCEKTCAAPIREESGESGS